MSLRLAHFYGITYLYGFAHLFEALLAIIFGFQRFSLSYQGAPVHSTSNMCIKSSFYWTFFRKCGVWTLRESTKTENDCQNRSNFMRNALICPRAFPKKVFSRDRCWPVSAHETEPTFCPLRQVAYKPKSPRLVNKKATPTREVAFNWYRRSKMRLEESWMNPRRTELPFP